MSYAEKSILFFCLSMALMALGKRSRGVEKAGCLVFGTLSTIEAVTNLVGFVSKYLS